ncbi:hypothetical protein PSECIP111854_00993 [Pseudoalteromonas sp. CIP111854]|uniref:Tail specific protease domain-containing protein n=1 Tax=Pseudoalteromonas holothuriae TaxID=2963714 RepID=A0A9W4QTM1_9GAMM|nr:S41 family peptidase [Pseudoalteromonas sp. CIP111854]CAH9052555.1 hypothetical protein PSECIP111854_00993 [Pseudoalteromonas sp. CIP111854]
MRTTQSIISMILCIVCLIIASFGHAETAFSADKLVSEERSAAIEKIADLIAEGYVLPKVGEHVTYALLDAQKQGQFSHINSKKLFIEKVGEFLRIKSKDGHLGLTPMRSDKKVTHILQEHDEKRINNFAFEQATILPGNIGYLKFNKFHPDAQAKQVANYALNFLSSTSRLIIDLRECTGGSMELVAHIISHFVKDKTHLWDLYDRDKLVYRVDSYMVTAEPRLQDIPITILTSEKVISAAEFFTYTLKYLNRARIVGVKTQGLAHATGVRQVNDWLVLRLPLMRPVNPVTKTNWEQVGVKPDIVIGKDQALAWALAN